MICNNDDENENYVEYVANKDFDANIKGGNLNATSSTLHHRLIK
jgi:hypothetical protein